MSVTPEGQPLTEDEFSELILSVGTHHKRRVLPPLEVAKRMKRALDHGVRTGDRTVRYTPPTLAAAVGFKGPTMVGHFVGLLALPEEFRGLIEWGAGKTELSHLTFSTASMLTSLEQSHQREMLKRVFEYDLTKTEVMMAVQALKRDSSRTVDDAVQIALTTRPVKIHHELLIGALLPNTRMTDHTIPTGKKEAALTAVLRPMLAEENFAARIAERNYVISTTSKGKQMLEQYAQQHGTDPNTLVLNLCEERLAR